VELEFEETLLKPAVLVCDDDQNHRELLREFLTDDGFPVILAKDGREALRKANVNIGAMILDLHMPDLDGLTVCRRLAKLKAGIMPPTLILTGATSPELRAHALAAGALECLIKPVSLSELRVHVAALAHIDRRLDPLTMRQQYLVAVERERFRERVNQAQLRRNFESSLN